MLGRFLCLVLLSVLVGGCARPGETAEPASTPTKEVPIVQTPDGQSPRADGLEVATLGGGCFWCVDAVYRDLEGVRSVVSGYAGGAKANPTYQQVCTGDSGHAEVVQITFDPKKLSYKDLLEVFWHVHDPTTLNRQGNDVGTQYRSVIFYHSDEQRKVAGESKRAAQADFRSPIVTEISPYKNFYSAEDYHQDYFTNNPNQPYCRFVIAPKVDKFKKLYKDRLKTQ